MTSWMSLNLDYAFQNFNKPMPHFGSFHLSKLLQISFDGFLRLATEQWNLSILFTNTNLSIEFTNKNLFSHLNL